MIEKKCIKGATCLYCGSAICQYKEECEQLEAEKQEKVLKMAEAEIEIEKLQTENTQLKKLNVNRFVTINDLLHENNILKAENEKLKSLINMHLTTFDKCCVNGLIMSNNMSEVLNE